GQLSRAVVDFSFVCFMGLREHFVGGNPNPAVGAAIVSIVLCFAVASFSWINAVASTALACACFAVYFAVIPGITRQAMCFVTTCLLVEGLLIGATSRYVAWMFVALRKRDSLARLLAPRVV